MNFELNLCKNIIFKEDSIKDIGKLIKNYGKKLLFLYGSQSLKKNNKYYEIVNSLKENNINFIEYSGIKEEPSPEIVDSVVEFAITNKIDFILAVGGGSVIDTAKACSALITNQKGVENYLEGVGKNYKIEKEPIPYIAVPTTAGSGAEVTKNAVITSYEKKYKKSFRDNRLLAELVIADPLLTLSLPKKETGFGGMDALCQLIESFTTKKKNAICSALSLYFIPIAINSLKILAKDLTNLEARKNMLQASIISGMCLANSGLGAVHGFASGIGGMFNIPHGLICAILLPHIIKLNSEKDRTIYSEITNYYYNHTSNNITKFIDEIFELNRILNIPQDFKEFNIDKNLAEEIVFRSMGSSMSGNPVVFDNDTLKDFIQKLL